MQSAIPVHVEIGTGIDRVGISFSVVGCVDVRMCKSGNPGEIQGQGNPEREIKQKSGGKAKGKGERERRIYWDVRAICGLAA